MMSKRLLPSIRSLPLIAATVVLAGCTAGTANLATNGQSEEAAEVEIELTVVDRDRYDAVIAERHGQVVLVDFWATWCMPCVQQFPHTIELAERLRDEGLAVVTVSFDEPADKEQVVSFLRARNAGGVTNLISQFGGRPQSMAAFDITGGAVPHYRLYDRSGRLRRTFSPDPSAEEQFTLQEIDMAAERLLAE